MHGLTCLVDSLTHAIPLVRVTVQATLLDVSAKVHVQQEYKNDGPARSDCQYRFPVPARAAVCAFALRKEDGSKVVGVVKEKEEARISYDDAVKDGKLASLMEQDSPDTFRTSIGNLLPSERVIVELIYVTELTEGETGDSVRFHVPANVGCRYGDEPSTGKVAPPASTGDTFFSVDVKIESAAPISKVNCPSHAVSTELGPDPSLPDAANLPFANYARVTCRSNLALSSDFVVEITSTGLDRPRCVVERHPTQDSAAISLTVVPRFKLDELTGQEYVFLVDRSGSMGDWGSTAAGGRISLARKALVILLRALPSRDTVFNIVSFGSSHEVLWSKGSRAYNQNTLDEATRLVDSMEANMGGTEIRTALDSVFKLRDSKRPTSVFVLTDGDAWDLDGVLDSVKSVVSAATPDAPLRVFSLGIGESASTAMVDSLARVGRGIAQYVSDGESFTGKTARLLRAARSPPILNARLDFGVAAETEAREPASDDFEVVEAPNEESNVLADKVQSVNLFDESVDPLEASNDKVPPPKPVELPPPAPVQLAPHTLHSLYPGSRLHAYGIVTPASLLPDKVTLRGELATGEQLALDVPLVEARSGDSPTSPPLLHAIAARRLIQELEDGSHVLTPPDTEGDLAARTVEAAVVRLGKQYSLASTHTSFVAVDEEDAKRGKVPEALVHIVEGSGGGMPRFGGGARAMPLMAMAMPAPGGAPPKALFRSCAAPAAFGAVPPPPAAPMAFAAPPPAPGGQALFGVATGSPAAVDAIGGPAAPAPAASSLAAWQASPPVPDPSSAPAADSAADSPPTAGAPPDTLEQLARAQTFDGAFLPSALALLGPAAAPLDALPPWVRGHKSECVGVTLAVLAYMESSMAGGEEREAWEGMAEKASGWVALELEVGQEEVQRLVELLK